MFQCQQRIFIESLPKWSLNTTGDLPHKLYRLFDGLGVEVLFLVLRDHDLCREDRL